MKKWEELDEEERREWRESSITQAAIAMLRDLEAFARERLVNETAVGQLDEIRFRSGEMAGVSHAVDQLTRTRK